MENREGSRLPVISSLEPILNPRSGNMEEVLIKLY